MDYAKPNQSKTSLKEVLSRKNWYNILMVIPATVQMATTAIFISMIILINAEAGYQTPKAFVIFGDGIIWIYMILFLLTYVLTVFKLNISDKFGL